MSSTVRVLKTTILSVTIPLCHFLNRLNLKIIERAWNKGTQQLFGRELESCCTINSDSPLPKVSQIASAVVFFGQPAITPNFSGNECSDFFKWLNEKRSVF